MRRVTFLLTIAVGMCAIVASPTILAYNGGVASQNLEYDCGGSCHDNPSTCTVTMAASNATPAPGGSLTLWVNVSGGQASGSQLGVMIICALTTSNSQPSVDGWTITTDPSGSTAYNYYELDSYTASHSFAWQLTAPSAEGPHVLYARVMHGGDGACAVDYSTGLVLTVTVYSGGGGDDGGGTTTNIPSLIITSPSNAATVSGNITVSATVVSVDDIVSATLKIDGQLVGEKTAAPFTWVIDTKNLTENGHVITVTVTDSTGDTASKDIAIFVDNQSEVVSMLEWLVTMGAGTIAIISVSGILIVLALYIRKRVMSRGAR